MYRIKLFCFVAVGIFALESCTKDVERNLEADEKPLYITKPDSSIDFSTYATFSLADSVAVINNNQLIERVRVDYDAAFIDAIAAEMQSRGFARVGHGDSPDLGISISRIYNDHTGIIDYSDYWGGYSGYWDPYYWGYPGYDYYFPPVYGTYTVTEGGVAVDMFDLKNAAGSNQLRQVWSGLVRGTGTFSTARAAGHAQALFQQSPYITK
ncbi:MAG TPA: DUF4136 domain-containing protein [Chitinophagaceae bacterium]|nr:DUF4136 domain-containing protein [Chitinophagaceae bacterium]